MGRFLKSSNSLNRIYYLISFLLIVLTFSGCDKQVSRSPVESEAPKGFIYIDSNPRGFTIFVNDRNTGRLTPDSISYIDAAEYEINLKKKYFKDTSVVVLLNEDEKRNLFIDIISNPSMYGNINLTTVPAGASITINDSVLNKITPVTFRDMLPGSYRVKYSLFNHRDLIISAIVESGKTNSYSQTLRDTSVWVDYQVYNSGIQSNSLTAITVDHHNVKWIGTLEKGLIKYDEVSFINYNTANSPIPDNRINCISVDQQNRIWVGTDFGIGIFDGSGWTIYNRNNSGLTSELTNTIKFDNNGNAWIGTSGNLVKFDGINWSVYEQPQGNDWINDIYIENDNKLYLGTKMDGIYIFENETFSWVRWWDYHYCTMTVTSIDKDQSNEIWFCFLSDTIGRSGISRWNGSSFTNMFLGFYQVNVNDIFIDGMNNKWVATVEGFFAFDSQNNSTFFRTNNSLISSNNINSCVRDLNGNVWLTTFASGLNKYKPPR